jgi:biopolymer transport protein ExbD
MSAIVVSGIDAREENLPGRDESELLEKLRAHLAAKGKTEANPGTVRIQGDGRLRVKAIIRVMDVCRKTGFTNVNFVPPGS